MQCTSYLQAWVCRHCMAAINENILILEPRLQSLPYFDIILELANSNRVDGVQQLQHIYPNTSSKERTSNNMSAALKWREKNELIIKGRTSNKLARQLFECRCPTQLITTPTSPSVTCCYIAWPFWEKKTIRD